MRTKTLIGLVTVLTCGAIAPAASAASSKKLIKGSEVGYFGSATVTYRADVFVYSKLPPRTLKVTVCLNGKCHRAVGHNTPGPWYSTSFSTRGYRMGDPVRFTILASAGSRRVKETVTRPLLCMHNDGSTPQS